MIPLAVALLFRSIVVRLILLHSYIIAQVILVEESLRLCCRSLRTVFGAEGVVWHINLFYHIEKRREVFGVHICNHAYIGHS